MQKDDIFQRIIEFNKSIEEGEDIIPKDKERNLIDIINDVANYGKSIDIVDTDTNNKMNALFDTFINSKRLSPDTISKIKQIKRNYNDYVVTEREKLPTDSFTIRPTLPPSSIVASSLVPSKTIKNNKRKRRNSRGGKTNKRKRESVGKSNKSKK